MKIFTKIYNYLGLLLTRLRVQAALRLGVFGEFPDAHAVGFSDTVPTENGVATMKTAGLDGNTTRWLTVIAVNPAVITRPTAGTVRDVFNQARRIGLDPSELHIRVPEGRIEKYTLSEVGL